MIINELLKQKNMTKYRLSKESKVPQTTIIDICSGKTSIRKCSSETLYKIAKSLDVQMEELMKEAMEYRAPFEIFKSNICHILKEMGDLNFIIHVLEHGIITEYFHKKWYAECLYMLAMIDYLCRENSLPLCTEYDSLRSARLSETIYPCSVLALCYASKSEDAKEKSKREAIPEFMRFNIVEAEVRNVY